MRLLVLRDRCSHHAWCMFVCDCQSLLLVLCTSTCWWCWWTSSTRCWSVELLLLPATRTEHMWLAVCETGLARPCHPSVCSGKYITGELVMQCVALQFCLSVCLCVFLSVCCFPCTAGISNQCASFFWLLTLLLAKKTMSCCWSSDLLKGWAA